MPREDNTTGIALPSAIPGGSLPEGFKGFSVDDLESFVRRSHRVNELKSNINNNLMRQLGSMRAAIYDVSDAPGFDFNYFNVDNRRTEQMGEGMALSREELDAKLERSDARMEASEARIEQKLQQVLAETKSSNEELRHEMRLANERLTGLVENLATEVRTEFKTVPRTAGMVLNAAVFTLALFGAIAALLAYGGDRFDGGVQVTTASVQNANEAKRLSEQNSQQLKDLTEAVKALATSVQSRSAPQPTEAPKQP